jgi:hypothetical protein
MGCEQTHRNIQILDWRAENIRFVSKRNGPLQTITLAIWNCPQTTGHCTQIGAAFRCHDTLRDVLQFHAFVAAPERKYCRYKQDSGDVHPYISSFHFRLPRIGLIKTATHFGVTPYFVVSRMLISGSYGVVLMIYGDLNRVNLKKHHCNIGTTY